MPIYPRRKSKPPLGVAIDRTHPLSPGLVFAVPMNDGTGNPHDVASRIGAGTNNGATWISGLFGPALSFNGTTSYVDFGVVPVINAITGTITISIWLYMSSYASDYGRPISNCDGGPSQGWEFVQPPSGGGNLYLQVAGAGFSGINLGILTPLGRWTNIVYTYNGAMQTFYVNGVVTSSGAATGAICAASSQHFTLGVNGDRTGFQPYFQGSLDLPMVWNRGLSAVEVESLYADPWQVFLPPAGWLFHAAAPSFTPWIYGDQIEANALG